MATPSATTPATTPATPLATAPIAASASTPDLAPETKEVENKEITTTTQELAQTEKQLNDEDEKMATASKKTTNV